jgi:tetratricopeptide (TPR) repeat protein
MTPRVGTPRPRTSPGLVPRGTVVSPGLGRNYYFQGDYRRAAEVYEAYLYENPVNAAPVREELGWVYLESGNYTGAAEQYRAAHTEYRTDLNRGHNVEAARHGLRTCDSALDVLDIR